MDEVAPDLPRLFNSPLEAGIRAVTILEALRPMTLDLADLVVLDHAVVHSGDLGGPHSLHPAVPGRKGELLVRRALVEESLILMRRFHMVLVCPSDEGLEYRASDEAAAYVELLESEYSVRLKTAAGWIAEEIALKGKAGFLGEVRMKLDTWTTAFIGPNEQGTLLL
ncbi:ABC-three component system middle component 2 [Brevundimonas sp.]|uniref:ABC-three component system middle component 2 n=1 Tax=Brevundimonas sp. TaxID=1871086 RepID=UPI0017A47034|nr:ABC-three component system middle component 2 [Brevundimonas sp.]MBA4806889.1 threonine efflux protein [Brevundimonas sp.]